MKAAFILLFPIAIAYVNLQQFTSLPQHRIRPLDEEARERLAEEPLQLQASYESVVS